MNHFFVILGCLCTGLALSSCYKAPKENECCTAPVTNNPVYTREKADPATLGDMVDAVIQEGINHYGDF